jgi:DNA modification methylase
MTVRIVQGHVMDMLRRIDDESVHCVVTSPPYYGLRSYGTEPQVWGGDWDHNHDDSEVCRCGRWVGHLGLEPTPELFIQHLVEVFREVRRVLRKDGTLWLNIGDSYATGLGMARGKPYKRHSPQKSGLWKGTRSEKRDIGNVGNVTDCGSEVKNKDLLMLPAQLALALRADGWWLRSEIVWAKKAPMPESVTDRPTCAHEKVFLLTKSARYFYDAEAVKEEADPAYASRYESEFNVGPKEASGNGRPGGARNTPGMKEFTGKRNMRNVWWLGPEPFPEAHFATFVSEIPRRAILAGTSAKGVCPKCGAPWVRVVEQTDQPRIPGSHTKMGMLQPGSAGRHHAAGSSMNNDPAKRPPPPQTIGWRPSCSCDAGDPVPATCCDPFLGSGTTALVADQLGRDCIGIELSSQYAAMADRRLRDDAGMFASIAAE